MKSIFITGAASGIGRETALLFAKRGWKIAAVDMNKEGLESLQKDIGEDGCFISLLDVTRADDYQRVLSSFLEQTNGSLDALFNCAGIMRMGPFEQLTLADHHLTYNVNVLGVINGIHTALDALKRTPNACIVSMCSASAFYGVPDLSSYSSSKFAVRGLTEALNIEFEKYDIRVTDLMPLYVNTPMVSSQSYEAGTLKTFGAKLTAPKIAAIVWQAVHGKKVHWVPTAKLKFLTMISRLFPFAERSVMKAMGS